MTGWINMTKYDKMQKRKLTKQAALTILADKKNALAFFNSPEALQFCGEALLSNEGFCERLVENYEAISTNREEGNTFENCMQQAIRKAVGLRPDNSPPEGSEAAKIGD